MKNIFNIDQDKKILLLQILFVTCMILANTVGIKVTTWGPITFSVSIWLMPIIFLITDILSEVKGKKFVGTLTWLTTITLIFSYIFIQISVIAEPAARYAENNPAFVAVFKSSARIFMASIIAFILSQLHDAWAFQFLKEQTKGRFLWLRNNLSTIASQLVDTVSFMFLAFYAFNKGFGDNFSFLFSLIIPYWLLKCFMSIIETPFVYLAVRWLKEETKK